MQTKGCHFWIFKCEHVRGYEWADMQDLIFYGVFGKQNKKYFMVLKAHKENNSKVVVALTLM